MATPLENFITQRLPVISRSENHANWFGNVSKLNAEIVRPESRSDIALSIKYAEQKDKSISVFGSKWSFTDCAIDSSNDIHLDTSELKNVLGISELNNLGLQSYESTVKSSIIQGETISSQQLVYVEAGIKLHDLNCFLDTQSLALHTMGGSSGQSLAGAVNTATNGADLKKPPLSDAVRAIHLFSYGGEEYWLEPANQYKVTKPDQWQDQKLKLIYDDDLFYSVLISFGCSGIVCAFVIETEHSYTLRSKSVQEPWGQTKIQLSTISNDSNTIPLDFFEAIITHENECRVTRRVLADDNSIRDYPDRNNVTVDQTDPQAQIDRLNRCWGFNILGWRIGRNEIDKQIQQTVLAIRPDGDYQHKSWIIHTFQPDCPIPPKEHSLTERRIRSHTYIVDARFAVQIIDELRKILLQQREGNRAIIVTINLRMTGQSCAYLATQRHPMSAHLEIYLIEGALGNSRFESALNTLIQNFNAVNRGENLKDVKIRPHWGQMHDPGIFDFKTLYPKLGVWQSNINKLKNGSTKTTFESKFAKDRKLL